MHRNEGCRGRSERWSSGLAAGRWRPGIVLIPLLALTMTAGTWYVDSPYPLENERFGVGLAGNVQSILTYDLEGLGVGWYLNWSIATHPPHPNGAAFMQTIRLEGAGPAASWQRIREAIAANPGSVWQIGNEPDSPWQDDVTPEEYARAYHDLYHFVKGVDGSAQVAFGGMVQATPLRMAYLDHIWQAYSALYGVTMPVDVWTIHGFVLREGTTGWGASIPAGMGGYAHLGMDYEIRDHDDMILFAEQIVRFRQWMADHGQRDKPLVVNEYGILMWSDIMDEDGQDFSDDRVIAFMVATFDYFRTATDPALGYPADGNRLVQAWAWYSLDDDLYQDGQYVGEGYNGDLFTGSSAKVPTELGQAYADYVQPLVGEPYVDLCPLRLHTEPAAPVWEENGVVVLTVEVANWGRQPASGVEVQFWDGDPEQGGVSIGSPQVVAQVPGRYEGVGQTSVSWTGPVTGTHTVWVAVDPGNGVTESNEGNNRLSRLVLVATDQVYLPLVMRAADP